MSLYPGAPRWDSIKAEYDWDEQALKGSMGDAIEDAMADIYKKLKGTSLPVVGKEDRRILFVAIARGILKYLEDHETELLLGVTITHATGSHVTHTVSNLNLNIQMDK